MYSSSSSSSQAVCTQDTQRPYQLQGLLYEPSGLSREFLSFYHVCRLNCAKILEIGQERLDRSVYDNMGSNIIC